MMDSGLSNKRFVKEPESKSEVRYCTGVDFEADIPPSCSQNFFSTRIKKIHRFVKYS